VHGRHEDRQKEGKNPREVAEEIIGNIPKNTVIEKAEIAGPGFINITLLPEFVASELLNFDPVQKLQNPSPKKTMLDFGSPNIAKPLHFGNLRSIIIGESLSRVLRHAGHEVVTDNFIGDWGTQFGKLIVAIRKWGNRDLIDQNPIEELVKLYRRFHEEAEKDPDLEKQGAEEFRKMEQEKDPENTRLWKWIVEESIKDFSKVTQRMDAHYEVIRGESFYESYLPEVIEKLEKSGVATREEGGALVVHFPEETKLSSLIFQKTDGATLYQTRDIAKIFFYLSQGFEKMVYVVGNDQVLHFQQVFKTAHLLGLSGEFHHVRFGMVRLPEGKMSARSGRVVEIDEVLNEAKNRSLEILRQHNSEFSGKELDELAEIIAMGALKFNDLSQNRRTDITFDWDKMLSFEGFSAPFLQYSAVRCASILRKAGELHMTNDKLQIGHKAELSLAKKILGFPAVVLESADSLEPHHLAKYLFELAGEYNSFYANCPVLKAEGEEKKTRLFLTQKTGDTLKQGLYLLGIKTPEKM
jgi:arginyl-tRNA synthetase